jgi:quinol-cytochrome oxidoreductase complex cytochrome b subunit
MRLINILNINILNNHLIDYPTPSNINYLWGFGSTSGFCLTNQIITGVALATHYTPQINLAFDSVEHIIRDVNYGWFIKYIHSNGASVFFITIYIHIGRALYFKSYRKTVLWITGVILLALIMATAFLGYVLPWGQMSFWGTTVITNLASVIPICGESIAKWLWGGFSIGNATLNRFFSLHYLIPFLIVGLTINHLSVLHINGSTNPLGITSNVDAVSFYPYLFTKDIFGLILLLIFFSIFIFFNPNLLGHADNYIRANSLSTPIHIVPEWYFLPFYAILRSIPNKEGGVICFGLSIFILLILPLLINFRIKSAKFDILSQVFFWFFIVNIILLGFLGSQVVEYPFIKMSQISAIIYFFYFLIILPFLSYIEHKTLNSKY